METTSQVSNSRAQLSAGPSDASSLPASHPEALHHHLHLTAAAQTRGARAANRCNRLAGPVPGGDRPRLADAVTWHHYPIAIGAALYARLVSWEARALLLLYPTPCSRLRRSERFVIFVFSFSVRFVARFD
jgi:hypothetical protein